MQAVIDVESRGGFLPDGRPKILFERHYFSRLTKRRFDGTARDVSAPRPGGYAASGAGEHARLAAAMLLDRSAALQSASWGLFQIMGANHAKCGFASVEDFVAAMYRGEAEQLQAFVAFVKGSGLAKPLRERDWRGFARGYNGPAFARNAYDHKLEASYLRHAGHLRHSGNLPDAGELRHAEAAPVAAPLAARRLLRLGQRGEDVRAVQEALGLAADGMFGPETARKVIDLQRASGLAVDGVVGPATLAALRAHGRGADRPVLRKGARSADVRSLQSMLGIPADGVFGPATHAAVVTFQGARGLAVDGVVGPRTWATLAGSGPAVSAANDPVAKGPAANDRAANDDAATGPQQRTEAAGPRPRGTLKLKYAAA